MASVNKQDTPEKVNSLGQFFTPKKTVEFCLSKTKIVTPIVIEPSCGTGAFLDSIKTDAKVIGIEVDEDLVKENVVLCNFYDYNEKLDQDVTFIGNPPFHLPAVSVTDHKIYGRKDYIKSLKKKYDIKGIREEAVFFILKSVDLALSNNVKGHIYYILPKTIFHNNSKAYKTFFAFLNQYLGLMEVYDLPSDFDRVSTDLCYVHFEIGGKNKIDDFYGIETDVIDFRQIFKKTYLGSVPCESVLLSVRDEPLCHFKERLIRLFSSNVTKDNVIDLLSYNGEVHLMALKKRNKAKIDVVLKYIEEIKTLVDDFSNDDNYKPIQHRKEIRYYFRHEALKRASFIYQLNPNPCRSFYFPGNCSKGCLDYHGYCDFDVNRNCSPSANRTVPIDNFEDNLTEEFKVYWDKNAGLPYEKVIDYLSYVLESDWYKEMKQRYQRFYFGCPREFMKGFLK